MFQSMASGPTASVRRLVRSEILGGKLPEFRLAQRADAHLFTGIPDAFDDGAYGFHIKSDQYMYHVGLFFELDETIGTLRFRDTPDVLGYAYEPASWIPKKGNM